MAEGASRSQDDAEQGYNSGSSDSASIASDTELELTVTAQAFQETFVMDDDGVKQLLLVPTENSNASDLVSIE